MKGLVLKSVLGLFALISGFVLFFLAILEAEKDNSPWILGILSVVLVVAGVILLLKTNSRSKPQQEKIGNSKFQDQLDKNNQLMGDWSKTIEQRDKLRVLELSERAKDEKP